MSGMILEEEEAPAPRLPVRWIGAGVLGLLAVLGIGTWAVQRGRGSAAVEPVVAANDSTPPETLAPAVPAVDSVRPEAPSDPGPQAASPASAPAPGDASYRSTTWVWLRANPVNTAEQLAVVNPNQVVVILERRFGWARVQFDGREGWMSTEYLERVP